VRDINFFSFLKEDKKKEQQIFGDWVECRFVVVAVAQQIVSLLPNMVLFSASLLL
jgi:hypothetical protein